MGEVAEARLPDPGDTVSHGAWGGDFILKACGWRILSGRVTRLGFMFQENSFGCSWKAAEDRQRHQTQQAHEIETSCRIGQGP